MTHSQADTDLDKAYDIFFGVMSMKIDMHHLKGVVSPEITGFGTTIDERIHGLQDCYKLVEDQIRESENANFEFIRQQLRKKIIGGGTAALFIEEGEIKLELPEGKVEFPFRMSTTLEKSNGEWKVVHWHGSTPVLSEKDTWHIKEHQGKTERLELQVQERTQELHTAIEELKAAQEKLIVQEKLASLGQLAAGIAHEIKNPMNFVNNFSELSVEYVDELRTELAKLPKSEITTEMESLFDELESNLKKIHQHGTRADNIVKSMLMHSRGGTGLMEPTDLNALIGEYVNLAFHGMRAGKTAINSKITLNLDPHLTPVSLNTEDFSRVVLNLCKNAFDAMREKTLQPNMSDYLPELKVETIQQGASVLLTISDNGPGVPDSIKQKLFDPFFTTKKGTEGTGLGLSITHDIIKSHSGSIDIDSKPGEYTHFNLTLPIKQP